MNNDKIILDLCGGTGSWSKPYRDAGYDVRLITLPEHDVLSYAPPRNVYGILAAPPCTMFSLARTTAKLPRDLRGGIMTVEACLRIIWECQYDQKLQFWALENPTGLLRRFLGNPPYRFEHWQFDNKAIHCKPTDIWGHFNAPNKPIKTKPDMFVNRNYRKSNWQNPPAPEGFEHITDRAAIRAITPQGFAKAFMRANQ